VIGMLSHQIQPIRGLGYLVPFVAGYGIDAMSIFEDATKALEGHVINGEFRLMGECIPIIEALQNKLISLHR
jgi:hypothetical protein